LGPIGTGFFFASEAILNQSVIHHVAAYSVDTFNMSTVPPSVGELVPKTARYSYGTFPGPMYDGAKAAMKFYLSVGPSLIEKRVKHLSKFLMDGLMAVNNQAKGPNGTATTATDGKPLLWKMHNSQGPIIQILTPLEDISRGAQVGFIIKDRQKEVVQQSGTESISAGTSTAIAKENMAFAKPPSASQRFCDYARKNSVILRYVAENDIHCVRVSTHYYNNQSDLNRFFEVLNTFLKEEGWI
jgi:selenocysteine lyase/cysteine desulfurase